MATSTWLGCSHTVTKNENTASTTHPERKLAGVMDAAYLSYDGLVILFYKDGNKIIIQRCEDYTVLNRREDCHTKPGTLVARVPVEEFKVRLKLALSVRGPYPHQIQPFINIYKSDTPSDVAELKRQQAELEIAIKRIQDFIKAYGQENAASMEAQERELKEIKDKIAYNYRLADAIRIINKYIDNLVDQIIGQSNLQKFVYLERGDPEGFGFYILKSYTETPGISAQFVNIKAGSFLMGSPSSEKGRSDDELLHSVTLTKDFEMQQTEVTQAQWVLLMGYNPSKLKYFDDCQDEHMKIKSVRLCPNLAVENVSWESAQSFIKRLNEGDDGYVYRLPTEAEWEFAARGGTQTPYWCGELLCPRSVIHNKLYENVGENQQANPYGLYDMHGNVSEWVQDWYGSYASGSQIDPVGPAKGTEHIARIKRSASRFKGDPTEFTAGFRLVRTPR